jgi:hypothetical protein
VVLNRSREDQRVRLPLDREMMGTRRAAVKPLFFANGDPRASPSRLRGGVLEANLPPLSGAVFLLE